MTQFSDKQLAGLVIVGLGVAWYIKTKTVETVGKAAEAVNPLNNNNAIYTGVNTIFWPEGNQTLGGKIYDIINGEST